MSGISFIDDIKLPDRFREKLEMDLEYLSNYMIERIFLFGSCARGDIKITSDIDLLVLTKEYFPREVRGEIHSELEQSHRKVSTDVVFYTEEDYEKSDCLLVKLIKKKGVLIWKRN